MTSLLLLCLRSNLSRYIKLYNVCLHLLSPDVALKRALSFQGLSPAPHCFLLDNSEGHMALLKQLQGFSA